MKKTKEKRAIICHDRLRKYVVLCLLAGNVSKKYES